MKLSVIVIAYNEEQYLPNLLTALSRQTDKDFELIVVDSHSSDKTEEIALSSRNLFQSFQFHKLEAPRGPAYARNRGAELATNDRLLFLDADTSFGDDFIEKALAEIERRSADLATCPLRIVEGGFLSSMGGYFLNFLMLASRPVYTSAYGACLFSTKAVHSRTGGFDETLGICEDCHYVKRAMKHLGFRFKVLKPVFYTSDRRARSEGGLKVMAKYLKVHLYRLFTGKEILQGEVDYTYGNR